MQFGERWGRHWLDVARFAESSGEERNFTFPEAWRYRDWVIGALNADKPYDDFIREQIAGDLLPANDDAERDTHLVTQRFKTLPPARKARVLVRGELDQPGERRGFVTVLGGGTAIPTSGSGRAELANWLVAKANPLTARVAVNRVWQHLFGMVVVVGMPSRNRATLQGLVRTADHFGATGDKPSHPELLDFLALKFMAAGWSVKSLIRTIVLSRGYQLGSAWDPKISRPIPTTRCSGARARDDSMPRRSATRCSR